LSFVSELKRRNVFRVGIAYAVISWLLLQVTDVVVPILELPEWVAKLVLLLLLLGLPLVLFFAWAYELTPEGLKRDNEVDPSRSITRQTGRKLDRTIIVVLVVALAWFAWDRYRPGPTVQTQPLPTSAEEAEHASQQKHTPGRAAIDAKPVIAVLPFKATGSEDGGFLASGLHDDLLTRLAKLGAFRVISRTSMMEYAETTKNMRQIGEELGAGYVLEGGVQAMGERVRINAQLIDAPSDEHIWAEVYNRELTANNLFDLQAEIAVAIAGAMQTELSPSDLALVNEVPTRNMEAYSAYLRGLATYATKGYVGTQLDREAAEAMEEAVRLDPNFALAWAGLATAPIRADCCTYPPEKLDAILTAVDRARELNPGMLETEIAWAEYLYRVKNEYQEALETLEALGARASGNSHALRLQAWLLRRLGQYEPAYKTLLEVWQLEPRSASTYIDLVMHAWLLGDCDAAGRHAQVLSVLSPNEPGPRVSISSYELECNGNAARALDLLRGVDFTEFGGWEVAAWAAIRARDARFFLSLTSERPAGAGWAWPIWQQLNLAFAYRYLQPDETLARGALDRAAEMLADYENNAVIAEDEEFAAIKSKYYGLIEDSVQTRYWIDERKKRFHYQLKGDLWEEANNHIYYAWDFACAGLLDEAVEELRVMLEEPGGHRFPLVDGAPQFDVLVNHPEYKALRERFGKKQKE